MKTKLWVLVACSALLFGCGGSGGGSGSSGSSAASGGVTYTGVTTPATITTANANSLASTAASGDAGGGAIASFGAIKHTSTRIDYLSLAQTIVNQSELKVQSTSASIAVGAVQQVNQTVNATSLGGTSGTVLVVGSADDVAGYGTLTMTFNQFVDGAMTMNGSITLASTASSSTMTFTNVTMVDVTGSFSLGGSIKVVATPTSETVTMNFAASDSVGHQEKVENFVAITTLNGSGAVVDESVSGRVYDSVNGYLDITTTTPMVYLPAGSAYPSSGGPFVGVGAGNTSVRITPIDSTNV
ncbi:MAG: hypothetical protein R8M46_04495, partial [Ghiorsea sp.]